MPHLSRTFYGTLTDPNQDGHVVVMMFQFDDTQSASEDELRFRDWDASYETSLTPDRPYKWVAIADDAFDSAHMATRISDYSGNEYGLLARHGRYVLYLRWYDKEQSPTQSVWVDVAKPFLRHIDTLK